MTSPKRRLLRAPFARPPAAHESKIYSEFSHLYDQIFTRIFFPRIRDTIRRLEIPPGARVLEVGVGTGLSLSAYPAHCRVTGIDLADEMLVQARSKVWARGWQHVDLLPMDALNLEFEDGTFDYVTAFHVVSVVPDSQRVMNEMERVCRPGGTLVVINHFRSERRWLAKAVDLLDPVTRRFGWTTTLRFPDLFAGTPFEVKRRYKTSNLSLFTVAIARKQAGPRAA